MVPLPWRARKRHSSALYGGALAQLSTSAEVVWCIASAPGWLCIRTDDLLAQDMLGERVVVGLAGVEAAPEHLQAAAGHARQEALVEEEVAERAAPGAQAQPLPVLAQEGEAGEGQVAHVDQVGHDHPIAQPEAVA